MSKEVEGVEIDPVAKEQLMLYPVEQLEPIERKFKKLVIGIPRENSNLEKRIALRPEAVSILVRNGHEVLVESSAGKHAKFEDREYSEAGAKITPSMQEVFEADVVIKIQPPTQEELDYMKPGRTLVSTLHFTTLTSEYLKALLKKKIIAVAFEFIQDKVGGMPVVRTMSEIAGSTVMLIAAEFLSSYRDGKGVIIGRSHWSPSYQGGHCRCRHCRRICHAYSDWIRG